MYAHLEEKILVVSIIYSCHISSHRRPQSFDYFLESFFFQDHFRNMVETFKILLKKLNVVFAILKGGKGWCSLIIADINYNGKIEINRKFKNPRVY